MRMGKPVWGGGPGIGFSSSPNRMLTPSKKHPTAKLPNLDRSADLQSAEARELLPYSTPLNHRRVYIPSKLLTKGFCLRCVLSCLPPAIAPYIR